MAERIILTRGDPALEKKCRPVVKFDRRLHTLIDDMRETLLTANGVGLAAPQVGILRRVAVVMDVMDEGSEHILELVNPEIIAREGEQTDFEGCLSVPGQYGLVTRPNVVTVRAQDRDGNWFEATGEEIVARCLCHELEHLDGHLFVEHVDKLYTPEEMEAYRNARAGEGEKNGPEGGA